MACRPTEEQYGYEDSRFEKAVDAHFHCSICYNVLKEPVMCRNNEHIFCRGCITEHLTVNSHTCPECNEELTEETLRRAPRVLTNYLSELKIKCEYSNRGCQEYVRLEDMDSHVENCGFGPVECSNEECKMLVNKREIIHHESTVCEYRKVKCHNCEKTEQSMEELKRQMEKDVGQMKDSLKVIEEQVKKNSNKVGEVKEDVKAMVALVLDKLSSLEFTVQVSSSIKKASTLLKDLVVVGGCSKNSLERYFSKEYVWKTVSQMENCPTVAVFFVYVDQLFVIGKDSAQVINLNESPLQVNQIPVILTHYCTNLPTVIYQNRVFFIGGYNDENNVCDSLISELLLSAPFTFKQLSRLPEPRQHHSAEVFENKILILGGEAASSLNHILDSVIEFDIIRNECKPMRSLPYAVTGAASVRWRDKVILLGGRNRDGKALNNVLMYDSKTGETNDLPSMQKNRVLACAVLSGNIVVVMGGLGTSGGGQDSVEAHVLGSYSWEYLSDMNTHRVGAVAAGLL